MKNLSFFFILISLFQISLHSVLSILKKRKKKLDTFPLRGENDTKLLAMITGNLLGRSTTTRSLREGKKHAFFASVRNSRGITNVSSMFSSYSLQRSASANDQRSRSFFQAVRLVRLNDPSFVISGREIPIFQHREHSAHSSTVALSESV